MDVRPAPLTGENNAKIKKLQLQQKGINFLKGIVEDNGSIFHKIEQENDFGIDCIIEFFKDEEPINISIAFQIKSGSSYINKKIEPQTYLLKIITSTGLSTHCLFMV